MNITSLKSGAKKAIFRQEANLTALKIPTPTPNITTTQGLAC